MNLHLEIFNKEVPDKRRRLIDEPVNEDLISKNKFANNSQYVSESVYRRILNKITNYQWSFIPYSIDIINDEKKPYVRYIGLLVVPGFGIHTGIGTQSLDKKDNQNATAAAKTYAFKNACKEMGIAPNVGDELYDEELFEEIDDDEFDFTKEEKKSYSKNRKSEKKEGKIKNNKLSLKERIKEVKEAYELYEEDDFVAFIQIWNEDILELDDMDEEDWEEFLDYLENNKKEFEDF